MAQNREQRYATADDMRKALHGAEQASTVVERGEAQTVLFPPPPKTVGVPTQTVATPETVSATGETTVVRPKQGPRRVFPIAISAGVLILVACGALGFYALQKRNDNVTQIAVESPTPIGGPASTPTPVPTEAPGQKAGVEVAPTPKKAEKTQRNEEEKKDSTPKPEASRAEAETEGHEERTPDVPTPPEFDGPNRQRRPGVRVFPGGVSIRTFPDGSQIITTSDGMRVMVTKDGKRTVLNPPRPRRQPRPAPVVVPSP
jgi:hypothetical protein